jgi:eukaryotic-like serine/threonine-protein kinase
MALIPGTQLGPYEIISLLGAGGMGEVYRARDPRVGRDVAIKVSSEKFTDRFEREARAVAALNHSNICTLYDVGPSYLVMELVEGPTLADRIKQGDLPLEESLEIARQIADALEAAHEKGIIHRDLKPANIKIKPDGTVKVLDFGLAKVGGTPAVSSENSPTLSVSQTAAGVILGTAAYMSPEQAKGKIVDKRADIWAFGCVLYEMLTGRAAFQGEDVSEILASVIKGDVNFDLLPDTLHPEIRKLLSRCLQKDLKKRIRDIGDVLIELDQPERHPIAAAPVAADRALGRSAWKLPALILLGVIIGTAIAGIAFWNHYKLAPSKVMRSSFVLPEDQSMRDSRRQQIVAISADGTKFAYAANGRLFLKRLSEEEARPIPGAQSILNVFFSPDGEWVGFYSRIDFTLKKIAIAGGPAVTLCRVTAFPYGVSWQGDTIVFGQTTGIWAVKESGGAPELLVKPEPGERLSGPQILPGGSEILFAGSNRRTAGGFSFDNADIIVHSRKTGRRKVLVRGGCAPHYLSSGRLIYASGNNLMMVPVDLDRLEKRGNPVPVLEGLANGAGGGVVSYAVSEDGTLVYVPSSSLPSISNQQVLALVGRDGKRQLMGLPPGSYSYPRVSPDGSQIAVKTNDEGGIIWIYDLSGKNALRKLTLEGTNSYPVWSPDSKRLAFFSIREDKPGIFVQAADGSGAAERLPGLPESQDYVATSWSPKKILAFHTYNKANDLGIWTVSLAGERKAELFIDVPGSSQADGGFSPDGRWIAYNSNELGSLQLYVEPYPKTGASRYQISREGKNYGTVWSADGKELFFYQMDSERLVAAPIRTNPSFSFGRPVPLPIEGIIQIEGPRNWDLMPDGKRFLVVLPDTQAALQSRPIQKINIVLNWTEELRQRALTESK